MKYFTNIVLSVVTRLFWNPKNADRIEDLIEKFGDKIATLKGAETAYFALIFIRLLVIIKKE